MIRPGHKWYDIHATFGNFIMSFAAFAAFFILFISFQFIYIFAMLFVAIVAMRGIIGRRCPKP